MAFGLRHKVWFDFKVSYMWNEIIRRRKVWKSIKMKKYFVESSE